MMSQSTATLVDSLESIVHTFPYAIKTNAYEQASTPPGVDPQPAREAPNAFFLPFKDHRRTPHRNTSVESISSTRAPKTHAPKTHAPETHAPETHAPEMRDIVEILATVIEGHHVVECVQYRSKLEVLLLDPERLRAVTSKHRVLKADVLAFLYEDAFSLPKNPLVGDVIAHALRSHVVMSCDGEFRAHSYGDGDGPAVLLSVRKVDRYKRLEDARAELLRDGAVEIRPFASMRIAELREYALGVLPDIDPKSTKQQIVDKLKKRFRV